MHHRCINNVSLRLSVLDAPMDTIHNPVNVIEGMDKWFIGLLMCRIVRGQVTTVSSRGCRMQCMMSNGESDYSVLVLGLVIEPLDGAGRGWPTEHENWLGNHRAVRAIPAVVWTKYSLYVCWCWRVLSCIQRSSPYTFETLITICTCMYICMLCKWVLFSVTVMFYAIVSHSVGCCLSKHIRSPQIDALYSSADVWWRNAVVST